MNYKQNEKILQLTDETLIVGVDIAKKRHVARAQDYRGIQFGKALYFENSLEGFQSFMCWMNDLATQQDKNKQIIGMEPTGHYWLPLAYWLMEKQLKVVVVNPAHVKKSKELDDNSPTKNDVKDARVISRLIQDGRYSEPHLPEGIYAELREGMNMYDQLMKDLQAVQGRVHQWIDRYFPEYTTVFANWEGQSSIQILKMGLFPDEIVETDEMTILTEIRKEVKRGVGLKKVRQLKEAARHSIGIQEGKTMARMKINTLMAQYALLHEKINEVWEMIEGLTSTIPGVKEMTDIKGIGDITIAAFLAEVGNLNHYDHPEQIIKLAGLNLKLATSGKWKGQTIITKRGRPKLRALLFKVALPLVNHNPAFKALHQYFTTRKENPLKKKQSLIAICCKLIRILFTVGKKQIAFNPEKMLNDIPHFNLQNAA
ncbi:IS110 family transposase [Siminovitchia fortis]|uniref:IS110 family transposase n=1 Tax=Siminovitchia fortis TaxID=254758 RepID=A0A443IJ46_9BACI|nr:IS110 family transposase [Siminovitchia fortis]RWR04001.1 IS110 family transposase [Siminovitchia fortis]WHY81494.1 IS110 family transposase [Siminovitchia fortis]WHY82361.1 IS110 family transposase [Siminovitchia fortis]WHY83177.1 IS110 family transposase [Siminovitchia fortis]